MATTNIISDITKEIKYNRDSRDYDCFITIEGERQYIGSASTYSQAETKCCTYAYDYYDTFNTPEKAAAIVMSDASIPETPEPPTPAESEMHCRRLHRDPNDAGVLIHDLYPIREEHLYYDETHPLGDMSRESRGPLAYVGYVLGDGDGEVEVSFKVDGDWPPEVNMFGRDAVPLSVVEAAIANLQKLLADPRVQAARSQYEASQRQPMKRAA